MLPAQSSETTMSERPYLTLRSASRRARGRGMARVAAAREELCKKRRATRVFATTVAGRRLAATACSRGTAAQMLTASFFVTPENTSDSSVSCSDPFYARLSLSMLIRCLLAWQWAGFGIPSVLQAASFTQPPD